MAAGVYLPGVDEGLGVLGSWLQNKWNQEQAAKANAAQEQLLAQQNAYNSAEAEKQRQWEAEMSNTAYQRARKDMEAAGINPILLGGGADSASTPTGYAAASSASHAQHVPNMVNIVQAGINNGYAANKQFNDNLRTIFDGLSSFAGGSSRYSGTHIGFGN